LDNEVFCGLEHVICGIVMRKFARCMDFSISKTKPPRIASAGGVGRV
jgi:hypothetical protein